MECIVQRIVVNPHPGRNTRHMSEGHLRQAESISERVRLVGQCEHPTPGL